ncbi:hypothetical protein HMPREF9347_02483 [Escherichia coli MS 124-1]|uniref:Uncharacterized protein n=1 Tax=Escherichia coli MS 85-1 TaxID=679202 RepID=A0AAN3M7I2_ECOLX|nr:hypothetical protein HMPREF9536_05612 [Escherichia coli MS 84-1]EFK68605.1 hypothetical protein HMPREF9347_02483 [Escherichia coli MS 124-1]EFU34003.1 hypothetical protein HMPREF9350_04197 [Escherichia coli MS 85-1]
MLWLATRPGQTAHTDDCQHKILINIAIHTFIFTSAVVRLADIQRGEGKAEWQKRSLRGRFLRIVFIAVNHRQMRKQLRKTQQLCAKSVSKGYVTWPRRV